MLSERLLSEKTYENLIDEAFTQIPLYTKEWTNFNPSDPAVTILENLSLYTILQQSYMGNIKNSVKEKIFSLMGYNRINGKNARVMLEASNVDKSVIIPSGQRFFVGDLSFETNKEFRITPNKIIGIYGAYNGMIKNYSVLLDSEIESEISIFSKDPKEGMEIYIVINDNKEISDEVHFYFDLGDVGYRNEIKGLNVFSSIKWQVYTKNGFKDVKCRDYTSSLLHSGELRVKIPRNELEVYSDLPQSGFVLKGVLTKADFDIPPKVKRISGFLFEVWQKETKSICYNFSKMKNIDVYCDILEEGYISVFCREDDGNYYKYERDIGNANTGRFYNLEKKSFGNYVFSFDKEKYGFGPGNFDNAIKLVAYNEELMMQYDLGQIYGYDDQIIELPILNIVKDSFSLIISKKMRNGDVIYNFVKPDSNKENDFGYSLLESEGKIIIKDAGEFINGRIFMGGCATTRGSEGNVRKGTRFLPNGLETDIVFKNPAQGFGGRKKETLDELRNRFLNDMQEHYTAVEAEDYERIVKTTPGLCIQKVKAFPDKKLNKVFVVVKPYSTEKFSGLSKNYKDIILKRLDERRLLSTGIEILQPVYVPVDVYGVIYVKPHFENCREKIVEAINNNLDYINSDINFGFRLNFDEVFHGIENLNCVDYIYDLSIVPQNQQYTEMKGMDIIPAPNCLLYPGKISIEINTMQ